MHTPRRTFLRLATAAAVLPVMPTKLRAQTYPVRPVHMVVGYAPGGSSDIIARLIARGLSERLGRPFIIDNRPGAGSTIATEVVMRAPPDGYTLLFVTSANTINGTFYGKLSFDFIHDSAPVAGVMRQPEVLLAHPSLPAKTLLELIAYAKEHPGKITMASPGNGTIGHLSGELLKIMAGIDLLHVPYRGTAPAMTDLLAGQVQISFTGLPGSIEYARAGTLRALAVTTKTRSHALPDTPSVGEYVPGYEAVGLYGLCAPPNTAAVVVEKLNREVNATLADPKIETRMVDLGGMVFGGSPAEFGKLLADETEKWGRVIRAANIKPS